MHSSMTIDARQARPAGASLEEGLAALKCETKRLLREKSETFSYLCEETVTYGEVLATMAGAAAFFALMAVGGLIMEGGAL